MDNIIVKLKSFLDSDEGKDYAKQFADDSRNALKAVLEHLGYEVEIY